MYNCPAVFKIKQTQKMTVKAKAQSQQVADKSLSNNGSARPVASVSCIAEARKRKKREQAKARVYRAAENLNW